MKVLIIQEAGHHKENAEYRECFSLERAFINNGWQPLVYGKGHPSWNEKIDFDSFDFILNLENYDSNWLPNLANYNKAYKMLWSIDAHCRGLEYYNQIFKDGKYNLLLHSTIDYVTEKHTRWFPNAFCDKKIVKINTKKEIPFAFVGNYVNRKPLLDFLTEKYNLQQFVFVIGDQMVEVINKSKIHFNKNMANDLNYRNFETIGCGTCLLTDENKMYKDLGFKDMENVAFYKDMPSLIEKLNVLFNDDALVERIGQAGYELSRKNTYTERVKDLISHLRTV